MREILKRVSVDLFDKRIFFTSFIPLLISAFLVSGFFYIFHEILSLFSTYVVDHIPFLDDTNSIKTKLSNASGWSAYYQLLISISMIFVGLIADRVVEVINDKYYHLKKRGFGSVAGSIIISLKQNAIFYILLFISLPFLFIPYLNIPIHLALWIYLIKEPLFYDTLSLYANKDEYKKLKTSDKRETLIWSAIGASLFFVPLLGVFAYIIQLLIFAHFNLLRLYKLRV